MKKHEVVLELDQNLKSFTAEILFKVLLVILAVVVLKPDDLINFNIGIYDIHSGVFIPFLIVSLNLSLTLLTIFSTGRRRKSIYDFYQTKIISHKKYGLAKVSFKSDFKTSPIRFVMMLGAASFTIVNFLCLYKGNERIGDVFQAILNISIIFFSFAGYYALMWTYKENWISKQILKIYVNKKKLDKAEQKDLSEFLLHYEEDDNIQYINDNIILDCEKHANVFKQRLDTLLLEAVFLGALAFGTFVQITSPESMEQFGPHSKSKGHFKEWVDERWAFITQDFTNLNKENERKKNLNQKSRSREWTEQEYYFIIALGSLVCAVLYISVLLKRFPIIKAIENLFSEIKSAQVWNRREEDMIFQEIKADIGNSPDVIKNKLSAKKEYYTNRLQEKLAYCQLLKNRIETSLKIISTIRTIGLYCFFFVLLTGTSMISPNLTIIFVFILAYALIGSIFMQEEGRARRYWEKFTGSERIS